MHVIVGFKQGVQITIMAAVERYLEVFFITNKAINVTYLATEVPICLWFVSL